MRTHEAVAAALVGHGVDTVFGLMGDANMHYLGAFQDRGGRFVGVAHEASSVAMADGYHRVSGAVGLASVTHGPGLTNTVTPLIEAVRNRSEVLLVTGATPAVPGYAQEVDIAGVAALAGAGHDRVFSSADVTRDLNRAIQRVRAEGRPVVLDIPVELAQEDAGEQVPVVRAMAPAPGAPSEEALDAALGLIASAQRPVVLAGRGAVTSSARDALLALSDRLGAVVGTTVLGKDLFAGCPNDLGIVGSLCSGPAGAAIAEADCVVAFGASLSTLTGYGGILDRPRVVHVDVDPSRIGWFTPVDEAVVGDARLVAEAMVEMLTAAGVEASGAWRRSVEAALAAHRPEDDVVDKAPDGTVDPRSAMIALDPLLPADRALVTDVGRFALAAWPFLHVAEARRFTGFVAYGSIGLGLSGAIGAACADRGRLTVAAVGDAGFAMQMPELATAVREGLPLLVVVIDDGAYGAEYFKLARDGFDADRSLTSWPDAARVAEAMGARALTVRHLDDLAAVPALIGGMTGPVVLDVVVDPRVDLSW